MNSILVGMVMTVLTSVGLIACGCGQAETLRGVHVHLDDEACPVEGRSFVVCDPSLTEAEFFSATEQEVFDMIYGSAVAFERDTEGKLVSNLHEADVGCKLVVNLDNAWEHRQLFELGTWNPTAARNTCETPGPDHHIYLEMAACE